MASLSNKDIFFELIISNARDLAEFARLEDVIMAHCKGLSCERLKQILEHVERIRIDILKLREEIENAV